MVARLFHAASLLREHRGDGHIAALMIEGVGGLEAHVLFALDMGMPAEKFGRIHHLPAAQLAAVIDGLRDRGLIGDDGWLSEQGHAVKQRVEELTDDLAAKPYESLEPDELDELMAAPRAACRRCCSPLRTGNGECSCHRFSGKPHPAPRRRMPTDATGLVLSDDSVAPEVDLRGRVAVVRARAAVSARASRSSSARPGRRCTSRAAPRNLVAIPGTIGETAAQIEALGGVGIPVAVDHHKDDR